MSKADISTTPIRSRRAGMAGLAVTVSIAATASSSAPAARSARATADPVFALIETHKALETALRSVVRENDHAEGNDSLVDAAHDAEMSALVNLIETVPTTLAGVIASMTYVSGLSDLQYGRLEGDEISALLRNLAEALEGSAVAS